MPRLTQEQREARKINISIDKFGTDELILPTYYALQTKRGWKLVNPLTQERHISTRYGGMTPFKISRRPVKNAVFLDFDDEPISLNKFVKKDREKLLAMVEQIDDEKDIAPQNRSIVGFKNASRGRPEKLQKNIIWNREHKDDENDADSDDDEYEGGMDWDMGEVENEVVKRARGRPKGTTKFSSTEAKERKRTQTIASNKKKALERETPAQRERRLKKELKKGSGIEGGKIHFGKNIKKFGKNVGKVTRNTIDTIGKNTVAVGRDIDDRFKTAFSAEGRTDFPPAMRTIMSQLGEEIITSIDVKRTPVEKVLTGALSVFSLGKFGKRMERSYDDLFHLYLIIGLSNGKSVSLEKEAVITMTTKTGSRGKTEESNPVSPIPPHMTLTDMLDKTRELMGTKKFFGYSAKSNNCQDFLVAIFKANDIGDAQDIAFIKQDTASLFKDLPSLRKLSNTLTTIGARADVLIKGKGSKILSKHSNITMSDSDSDSDCDECPRCEGTGLLKKIRKSVKKEAKSIKKQGEDHFNKQVSLAKSEVSRRANEAVDKTLQSGLKKGHSALHKLDRNIEEVYGSGCCMGSSGQGLAKKATKRAVSGGQRDWIDLVKKCQKDEGCSYKEAMSIASALRKK